MACGISTIMHCICSKKTTNETLTATICPR
uniref:Uncharacterized protein n=1 Tax=Siphoviridae sp. ctNHj22 TaxID=2825468 RepID=A0A8S5VFM3_9CAUD|nr:MAG TPA: hypothetical protein [Siphoviridae sp. ctNHj22]